MGLGGLENRTGVVKKPVCSVCVLNLITCADTHTASISTHVVLTTVRQDLLLRDEWLSKQYRWRRMPFFLLFFSACKLQTSPESKWKNCKKMCLKYPKARFKQRARRRSTMLEIQRGKSRDSSFHGSGCCAEATLPF